MVHMSSLHWIILAIFVLLFMVLSLLSLKEKNTKVMLSMVLSSFIVTVFAAFLSLYVLDKYTKKAKILSYATQEDRVHESVIVRGIVKNIGEYEIGYCDLAVRVSNTMGKGTRPNAFFKPSNSFDFSGGGSSKENIIVHEETIVEHFLPTKEKKFIVYVRYPSYFEKPQYKLKLTCH